MGDYGKRLSERFRRQRALKNAERLVSVAIIRDGVMHEGFKSHLELRRSLGDAAPDLSKPGDRDGFMTSHGRFVDRREGAEIALQAEQIASRRREILSSDIAW